MIRAYYNDNDPQAVAWLRELIRRDLIADGEVDGRSILDVRPVDLAGFTQCHFFAGIGGWSCSLRLAGWPDHRPVWTGSPPCQPFSVAGLGLGASDERHLAPHFAELVAACRPPVIFGEQVASAAVFGTAASGTRKSIAGGAPPEWAWLDDLFERLEAAHYACGASDLPAAGLGAPHIRQRTFFGAVGLADAERRAAERHRHELASAPTRVQNAPLQQRVWPNARDGVNPGGLADSIGAGLEGHPRHGRDRDEPGRDGTVAAGSVAARGGAGGLADAQHAVRGQVRQPGQDGRYGANCGWEKAHGISGTCGEVCERPSPTDSLWGTADWLYCRDDRWRPVEPGTFPLADGVPARVGRLRGYGNAIVPQVAAEFIKAFGTAIGDLQGEAQQIEVAA